MHTVTSFGRQAFNSISSTFSRFTRLGSAQIAVGNTLSFRAQDIMKSTPISFSKTHAESIRIYSPRNLTPLENRSPNSEKVNPQEQKKIFTSRFFAYYAAQVLSRSKYTPERYKNFADTISMEDQSLEIHTKNVWQAFKKTDLWKNLTLPEKVRAIAIYYLFGEIARNFLEDLADNVMEFFITRYSSKDGVSSLFETGLEKMNRFLAYFESTSERYAQTNPRKSNFHHHLEADRAEGALINSITHLKPDDSLTPDQLFNRLTELFLEQFLPKLRIKEALLHKLRWSFNGNLEKAIWALPYALFIVLNIPFLVLVYTLEGFIQSSIKDALKITPKFFNPFKLVIPSISDLIKKHVNTGWNPDLKEATLSYLYQQIQEIGGDDLPPSTDLNSVIRRKIEAFVPSFLKVIRLHGANGNREEMKKILEPHFFNFIDNQFRLIVESVSKEQALLPLFSYLTKDDFIEKTLHTVFETSTRIYTKNESPQSIVTQEELLNKITEIMQPITKKGIKDTIGLESRVGSNQVQRFFVAYKKQFLPLLEKILEKLEQPTSLETLQSTLELLDRHRNAMDVKYQEFKNLFETSHPLAFRHVDRKLATIANAQNELFRLLIKAMKSQESFNKETSQKETLEEFFKDIKDPKVVTDFLDKHRQSFNEELREKLTELNKKRIKIQSEIEEYRTTIRDLDIQQAKLRINLARISPLPGVIQESCDQLQAQIPSKYRESLEELLYALRRTFCIEDQDERKKLSNHCMDAVVKELEKIKETLPKDIETSEEEIKRVTSQMKTECDITIDFFNIDFFEVDVSGCIQSARQVLKEIKTSTLELTSDPIVVIRPTQALFAVALAGGAAVPAFAPAPITAGLAGRVMGRAADPIGAATEAFVVSQAFPRIEKLAGDSVEFIYSDNVYGLWKQTLAVIALEELSKKK